MGIIDFFINLLKDPRGFIAGWIIALGPVWVYTPLFLIVFVETGLVLFPFLPGDSLLFAAGVFSADGGGLNVWATLIVFWVAAILGNTSNYWIARLFGSRIIDSGKVKALTPERMAKLDHFFERYGGLTIIITRFMPFFRTFAPFIAGTGHVAYSVLPVIAEVATETKIRPERPLGIAVIASQQAITASPISAATVALLGLLAGFDISLFDILKITIPATLIGVLVGAFFSMKVGKELVDDPEYQKRLKEGVFNDKKYELKDVANQRRASLSVFVFIIATVFIVLFGSFDTMRPSFMINGEQVLLDMPSIIEILMLSAAAIILLITRTDGLKAAQGSVFGAGMQAVVAIFGIAWMGDTFLQGNMAELKSSIEEVVRQMPWLFGIALFVMSILLYSQAATVRALMPLGIALGISPYMLIAMFPAVNGYFFIPNYPTVVAAINFDRTGTTRIGKYVLNHSFMMPGLVATIVAVGLGLLFIQIF